MEGSGGSRDAGTSGAIPASSNATTAWSASGAPRECGSAAGSGQPAAAVAAQPSNSKATFNKVLGSYDAREVRKGIETLRKRVEKHFGSGGGDSSSNNNSLGVGNSGSGSSSEDAASKALVGRVLRECEAFYGEVELRIGTITTNVYGGDVLYEWPRAEVKIAFSGR